MPGGQSARPLLAALPLGRCASPLVVAGWVELYDAANDLNAVLPVERKDEAEILMTFVREQNGGQGPGYTMLGILVRSSM